MEKLYTCEEVAARYGVKIDTVWRWIRSGELGAFQIGKQYRIGKDDLAAFEKRNRNEA